jgi:hypothetical protein
MSKSTLAFLNFNPKQQEVFCSILILSTQGLKDHWQIVKKAMAQVIFIRHDNVINQSEWQEIQSTYPQAQLVAYSENLVNIKTQWKLLTKDNKPPRRLFLINLLNSIKIERMIVKVKEKPIIIEKTVCIEQKTTSRPDLFLIEHYFLSIIQKSLELGHIYHCRFENNIDIFLLPQQNCYFCDTAIKDLSSLFLTHPNNIVLIKLDEKELKKQVKGLKTKALNDLLWHSAISVSQGRFMKNHSPEQLVFLKYWPDISQISPHKSYLKIAPFMSKNKENVVNISEKTQQKLSDVLDFHNACNILGLVDKVA